MTRFEEQTTIGAPAGRVYDYVSDFPRHSEWSGNGLQVTPDGSGPVAVGSSFSTEAKQFGTQREKSVVTEMTPGSVFAWSSTGALGVAEHAFHLSETEGATTLRKSAEIVKPTFLAKLTGFKLKRDIPTGLRRDLERIKAHLEGTAGT